MSSRTDGRDEAGTGASDVVDNVDDGGKGHNVNHQSSNDYPGAGDDGPVTADPTLEAVPSWEQMDALTGSGAPVGADHAIGAPQSSEVDDDG